MNGEPRFRFLLCDLDNTLYPPDSGLMQAVGQRMVRYMIELVGIPPQAADGLKRRYFHHYGTTMRGLILHHGIDPEDYLAFVHDLPLEEYIQPNPALDAMLAGIPLRKAVFTNADRAHAERVLGVLGVRRRFEKIIDVCDLNFNSKPHPSAYRGILDILDARAEQCILVEDAAANLAPAREIGMFTVLAWNGLAATNDLADEADIRIADIIHLADAIRPYAYS